MRTNNYNTLLRDFAAAANTVNQNFERGTRSYDYVRNGGHAGEATPVKTRLPLDVIANDEAFVISAYVPGVNPDNVEITFEDKVLTIRGEFPALELSNEAGEIVKQELYRGAFERSVTFTVPVDADAIEATYEHGVLTLRVPKSEAVRPKQIKVVTK